MMSRKDWTRASSRNLPQGKRFLILVEGRVTETQYIDAVKRHFRLQEQVVVRSDYTEPKGMVNKAKELKRSSKKSDPFDEVWCVFDIEAKRDQKARKGLSEALDIAKGSRIRIAYSNPCFEIWLVWHKQDQTAPTYSNDAQRACIQLGITGGKDGKHLISPNALFPGGFMDARRRAESSSQRHERNGLSTPEERNPSSDVYQLIDRICDAFPVRD